MISPFFFKSTTSLLVAFAWFCLLESFFMVDASSFSSRRLKKSGKKANAKKNPPKSSKKGSTPSPDGGDNDDTISKCDDLAGFAATGPCQNYGLDLCEFAEIDCPAYNSDTGMCESKVQQFYCYCFEGEDRWACALPSCQPCECNVVNVTPKQSCNNLGQVCSGCTCTDYSWQCS